VADEPSYDAWIDRLRLEPVLFDTMIVRHLCAVGGGDYLAEAFAGRLVWPEAVNAELTLQSDRICPLRNFLSSRPATVLEVDAADEPEVEDIRIDMYTKRAARLSDTEHLGEAQCLFFAESDGYPIAVAGSGPGSRRNASPRTSAIRPLLPGCCEQGQRRPRCVPKRQPAARPCGNLRR
jgi:hypothetical protein